MKTSSNLQKDKSIKELLIKLFEHFGKNNLAINDYWEADLRAIGIENIKKKEYLIYISTYNLPINFYFVEVEQNSKSSDITEYVSLKKFNNINFDELCNIIERFLFLETTYA